MKKAMKCMAGILALTLAFAQVAPVSAFAEETTAATEEAQAVFSGDCSAEGSSVTWTYNPTEKTLTFSGTGAIKDYQASGEALPWLSASDDYNVKKVVLEEGITSLPDFAEENGLFDVKGSGRPCTIILPESLTDFHYGTALPLEKNIIIYVKDGSAAYCDVHAIADKNYFISRSWLIYSSGVAENPVAPAEGTSDTGLTWNFDYETRQLTLSGTDDYQNSYLIQHLMPLMKAADKVLFDENFIVPEDPNETVMPATYTYLKEVLVDNPALQYFHARSQGIYCYYQSPFQTACEEVKEAYAKLYPMEEENPFEYPCFVVTNPNLPTYSGSCGVEGGDNVTWTYDVATATMTFSGTGEMQGLYDVGTEKYTLPSWLYGYGAVPNYHPKHIIIEEGITRIVADRWYLFGHDIPSSESERCTVTIPESLKNTNLFDYAINPNDYLTFQVKQQSVFYFQLMNAMDLHPDNHWIYESTGVAEDVIVSEDGMTEGSSEKGLNWKFDGEKRILYLSGTDVPARKGSALDDIQDLVSVAKTIVIDKDFVPPLGTDLTTWTNYYLKSTSNRDIYHNVYLYRGSLFDQHYLAAKALYKEYEGLTDEEEERYGIFNQGYYYIGESDTCGDVNLDGTVDILDAIYFGKYLAGVVQLSDAQVAATDCNGNGVTGEEADLTVLMKFLVGSVTDLPYTEE